MPQTFINKLLQRRTFPDSFTEVLLFRCPNWTDKVKRGQLSLVSEHFLINAACQG